MYNVHKMLLVIEKYLMNVDIKRFIDKLVIKKESGSIYFDTHV